MLDILKFIFSSFWVWLGALIMLTVIAKTAGVVFQPFASIVQAINLAILNWAQGVKK